jgi:transposase
LQANSFVWRSSNGRTEGFNHGLRGILWRAFGMLNYRHLRLRVLDRFGCPQKV